MKILYKLLLLPAVLGIAAGALGACGKNVGEHEHLYGAWTVLRPASCTENGSRVHTCLLCNEQDEEDIPALGHDFDGGRVTEAASCTQTGERTQTCRRCKTVVKTDVGTTPHNWDEGVELVHPTCQVEGRMLYTCKDCPATQTVSLGFGAHTPQETARTEAKCEVAGSISYICSVCKQPLPDEEIPALGHRWVLGSGDVEPTCTTPGKRNRRCEREGCSVTDTRTLPPLEHALPEEFTIDIYPTFESAGSKSQHCVRCGAHVNETAIPMLDENVPVEYSFRLLRNNGKLLQDPTVVITVSDGTEEVIRSTPSTLINGVFTYSLPPKAYTVTVSNLPAGYSAQPVTMEPGNPYCDLYLTAAPISTAPPAGTRYSVGSVLYDFVLTENMTSNGERYSLSGLLKEKKMVVLNFWATWCGPCQSEFGYLQSVYNELSDDFELLAIDQDRQDNWLSVKQFANTNGYSFPMAYDTENRLQSMFGITDIPATIIIDAEGVVCEIHRQPMTSTQQFRSILAPYLSDSYWTNPSSAAKISREYALPGKNDLAE